MRPGRRRRIAVNSPAGRRMGRAYHVLSLRWVLRLLADCGGHRLVLQNGYCEDDRMMEVLGIPLPERYQRAEMQKLLFAKHEAAERAPLAVPGTGPLARNLASLAEHLGLEPVEVDVLRFAILVEQHPHLCNAANFVGHLNLSGTIDTLAKVLQHPPKAVRRALDRKGRLCRVGLLPFRERGVERLEAKLALLEGFGDQMLLPHRDLTKVFSGLFTEGPPPGLDAEDYPHLREALRVAEAYLRQALRARAKGVNLLLHGIPGTGKTEFARMLGKRLGAALYEVSVAEDDGAPFEGLRRLRAYQLSQAFLEGHGSPLVVFDEAGDVLSIPGDVLKDMKVSRAGMKAWMHQTLEANPVPAVWIANSIESCDPALLRRFDVIQEFKVPPRPVRERILDRSLGPLRLPAGIRERILDHPRIPPAWVARTAKVLRSARKADPGLDCGPEMVRLLSEQLGALGAPAIRGDRAGEPELPYRLDCLQADQDLARIREGLQRSPRGRFCLYGPPGTGKTAFGRHIAGALGLPLMVHRASDLLDKFVGEAEKRIARMFDEAAQSHAVLLLDEADSFLRDRAGAMHSWEVTQVNEMLTQMEAFDGLFIASTNLMDGIDAAALRRFDLKIGFDFLKHPAAWGLFREAAAQLGLAPAPELERDLERLRHLTPGDFATALRRARFAPPRDARELLQALREECALKPQGRQKSIGF